MTQPRLLEVRRSILSKNDEAARLLRQRFQEAGVCVISLVSSPGSGKTAFLERVLTLLKQNYWVAALVGDLATDNDAMRLARSKVPVKQICTGTICHLDATMVSRALEGWELSDLDFLFIENVGNLVCPSSYDLGESARMVLLSVTEGEDKPLKYPSIFHIADAAIITKLDLAEAAEFDAEAAHRNIEAVRPSIPVFQKFDEDGERTRRDPDVDEGALPLCDRSVFVKCAEHGPGSRKRELRQAGFAEFKSEPGLVAKREAAVHHSHGRKAEPLFPDFVGV
jgi:hydrogenase nickel incorporation protein HypB